MHLHIHISLLRKTDKEKRKEKASKNARNLSFFGNFKTILSIERHGIVWLNLSVLTPFYFYDLSYWSNETIDYIKFSYKLSSYNS